MIARLASILNPMEWGLLALGAFYIHIGRFWGLVNPVELGLAAWLGLYFAKCFAIGLWDTIVDLVVKNTGWPKLPTTGILLGLKELNRTDKIYLAINSVIEYVFVLHVGAYMALDARVCRDPAGVTVLNTVVSPVIVFLLNDMFYAPAHRFLHLKGVYKYVHKHHHRQVIPTRGYLDAGNEHPIEQIIGMLCSWFSLQLAPSVVGLHAIGGLLFFAVYAALAMLNHTRYDVSVSMLPECVFGAHISRLGRYQVRDHETHHRFYNYNYAQYFMGWDYLMGTYKPYKIPPKVKHALAAAGGDGTAAAKKAVEERRRLAARSAAGA